MLGVKTSIKPNEDWHSQLSIPKGNRIRNRAVTLDETALFIAPSTRLYIYIYNTNLYLYIMFK